MAKHSQPSIRSSIVMALDGEPLLITGIHGVAILKRASLVCSACAAFLICAVPVAAQTSSSATAQASAPQQHAQTSPNAPSAVSIPSYPNSPAGLEKLIKDMLKLQKDGNAKIWPYTFNHWSSPIPPPGSPPRLATEWARNLQPRMIGRKWNCLFRSRTS